MTDELTVALVSDVFHDVDGTERLGARLLEARSRGAVLAVLPELPMNPWVPATAGASDADAELHGGRRAAAISEAARAAGVAVLGGAIVRDGAGRRHNRALVFDATGSLVHEYAKLHLPDEEGFREGAHYEPGSDPPRAFDLDGFRLGVQLCSDVNRPEGTHLLAAQGALAVLAPRANEPDTWGRWKLVLRANARTSCCWVVSVNRPRPELGVPLGGPSFVVAPSGEVALETPDTLAVCRLDRAAVEEARRAYPGYLPVRADVYARGWADVAAHGN